MATQIVLVGEGLFALWALKAKVAVCGAVVVAQRVHVSVPVVISKEIERVYREGIQIKLELYRQKMISYQPEHELNTCIYFDFVTNWFTTNCYNKSS